MLSIQGTGISSSLGDSETNSGIHGAGIDPYLVTAGQDMIDRDSFLTIAEETGAEATGPAEEPAGPGDPGPAPPGGDL